MQFDIIEYFAKTKQHLRSARIHYMLKSSGLNSAHAHLESVLSLHDECIKKDHKIQDIGAENVYIYIISYS